MTGTLVKICGVRSPEIARSVASLGADLMGLIFAPSRRQLTADEAGDVLASLERVDGRRPKVVGVFVNESSETMNELAERLNLDYVQLSGDEPADMQAALIRPVIRVLRLPAGLSGEDARREAERYLDCPSPARALMLDTYVAGVYGGTGEPGNWNVAAELATSYPVILAGGLRPDSVSRALESVRPLGVDVSSGVEIDGVKDPGKIKQFIEAVRCFDQSGLAKRTAVDVARSRS